MSEFWIPTAADKIEMIDLIFNRSSRIERFIDRMTVYRWRIANAWLVLTGRADIE